MAVTMTLDSAAGNVQALEQVLAAVRQMTGLKPFLRFELTLACKLARRPLRFSTREA